MSNLRAGRVSDQDRLDQITVAAPAVLEEYFLELCLSHGKAKEFLARKPLHLRLVYSKLWHCIDWLRKGGFQNLDPKSATNDLLDEEYVLIATFFDGIFSGDERVLSSYSDLCRLLGKQDGSIRCN